VNRLSKRLEVLASFIDKNDSLVDVGCDHGYLSIYLKEHNLCKNVICSDVNINALNNAKNNIIKSNLEIDSYLSDGIKDVPLDNINTIVISGMGSSTIIKILSDKNKLININNIVLQSNNDFGMLREYMNSIGYYMDKENIVFDKDKWYIIMNFIKNNKKNTDYEIEYGLLNNKDYVLYLINNYERILEKIPKNREEYNIYKNKIKYLKTIK